MIHPVMIPNTQDLEDAIENISKWIAQIQENGGWHAIDDNRMAFGGTGSSLKEALDMLDGWTLLAC